MPLKSFKEAFWVLSLQKKTISSEKKLYFCLYHDSAATNDSLAAEQPGQISSVIISDCSFSILNQETDEVLFTVTAPSAECGIGGKKRMVAYNTNNSFKSISMKFCNYSEVSKYVFDDTLVIQVNCTILCYTDPAEALEDGLCSVPLDDIRKELHSLYQEQFLADVTVKCGDEEFKVHKVILASQSPVFKRMFAADMRERSSNVVEISDIEPAVMSDLLAYIYTGNAPNLSRLAKELLNAANKYELPRLFAMCEEKLRKGLRPSNVVQTLLWASLLSAKLKAACLRFIHLHSSEVKSTSGWKHLKENADEHSSILVEIMEFTI